MKLKRGKSVRARIWYDTRYAQDGRQGVTPTQTFNTNMMEFGMKLKRGKAFVRVFGTIRYAQDGRQGVTVFHNLDADAYLRD